MQFDFIVLTFVGENIQRQAHILDDIILVITCKSFVDFISFHKKIVVCVRSPALDVSIYKV